MEQMLKVVVHPGATEGFPLRSLRGRLGEQYPNRTFSRPI